MIKRISLFGNPKTIGEQHGKEGKNEVIHSLETYERLFWDYAGINWKKARERALFHLQAIERYDSDLVEEMEGLASGAGVDFEDILVLNARSEIALTSVQIFDGCTAVAVTPPASPVTLLGQNWDWKARQKDSLLLLQIEEPTKPRITMVTEGGIIGKIGCNSAGIGVCLNALLTTAWSDSVPIHLGLRAILKSFTIGEAISKVSGRQMASAANFLVASDEGEGRAMAVDIEVSPQGAEVMFSVDGFIYHTNHICSNHLKNKVNDMYSNVIQDSIVRYNRVEQLFHKARRERETITEETLRVWFSDHFNYPDAICRHENKRLPQSLRMKTVFSIIMNLSEKKVFIGEGNPCSVSYAEV